MWLIVAKQNTRTYELTCQFVQLAGMWYSVATIQERQGSDSSVIDIQPILNNTGLSIRATGAV